MSYRRTMYIAVLFILLATMGCSLFRFVDNSSPEDIQKFETSKDDLWNQKKALEQEKAAHLKQIADQQAQIVLMNRGMSDQQTKIAQANRQIAESSKVIEDLTIQIKLLEEEKEKTVKEAAPVRPERETPAKTVRVTKKELQKKPAATAAAETGTVKIKVLSGDGNIASAREMAKRLVKMGYRVKLIDRGERSDFSVNTVYHTADHAAIAEEIVKKLGGGAVAKPLTWQSIFDLIVVTGKKP